MITGHTSHQIGLDADIWLTPMPDRILTPQEREDIIAVSMLKDPFTVDPAIFTPLHVKLIKRAASYPQVARIFVHPAIKKALCEQARQEPRLAQQGAAVVEPLLPFPCAALLPAGGGRLRQPEAGQGDDGCGKELAEWYKMLRKAAIAMANAAGARTPSRRQEAAHHGPTARQNATRC